MSLTLMSGCTAHRYSIYQYDNGDDYFREGLRRIVDRNGKIGFADERGRVVVSPRFAFAFPFENGVARVTAEGREIKEGEHSRWVSPEWFYIDREGNTVSGNDIANRSDASRELESALKAYVDGKDARIGIAVIIDGRDTVSVNGNRDFPMMSVFKFPLALAVAEWVDANGMSLDDKVSFGPRALLEDTYSPMLKKYGRKLTCLSFRELLEWALIESDNNAADILLKRVGGTGCASGLISALGASGQITIGASEEDMHRDPYLSYLNRSTPLAMAVLFDRFETDIRNRSKSFSEVAAMLERCRTGADRLSAPLAGTGVEIGHKTGTGFSMPDGRISALNDCGYVRLPDGRRYSIAVFIADSAYDIPEASGIIARISSMVYDTVKRKE